MSHHAIISLGSNSADKELKLNQALELLGVAIVKSSGAYDDLIDNTPCRPYLNIVAEIETNLDHDTLRSRFKAIELKLGRDRRQDVVAIDIDIVIFDGTVMRPTDYERPYFQTGVKLMLND
ncbi:MAG: 2-amino-4-hydroxy-6-hydroxymethyldihydropteridine diphosphokinase [Muribaculaceae bacterium]|nr:2-amino-4-hydroxy-6-hydroxymethyldihydropteridine diphosphokinase [Muribaculaceae bacterium]